MNPMDERPARDQGDLSATVQAPDFISPMHAFRDWRITADGFCSPRTGAIWTRRVMRAQCRPQTAEDYVRPAHEAPGFGCTCGIHAYYELSDAASKVDWRGVSGIVTVWGHIEAHAMGLRAECVRIEALGVYHRWTRRQKEAVAGVAYDLGVEVLDLYELRGAGVRFGIALPTSVVPGGVRLDRSTVAPEPGARAERHVVVGA